MCSDAKSDLQADRSVNLECDAGKSEVRLKNSIKSEAKRPEGILKMIC